MIIYVVIGESGICKGDYPLDSMITDTPLFVHHCVASHRTICIVYVEESLAHGAGLSLLLRRLHLPVLAARTAVRREALNV